MILFPFNNNNRKSSSNGNTDIMFIYLVPLVDIDWLVKNKSSGKHGKLKKNYKWWVMLARASDWLILLFVEGDFVVSGNFAFSSPAWKTIMLRAEEIKGKKAPWTVDCRRTSWRSKSCKIVKHKTRKGCTARSSKRKRNSMGSRKMDSRLGDMQGTAGL